MPLLVAPATGGVVLPQVGFSIATWYAPDGTVWPLTAPDSGIRTLADGVTGLDAAAIVITSDDRARGGVKVRHIQPGGRVITWPLFVYADDHQQFVEKWRQVGRAFAQTTRLGPGELEIARPDGTARRVQAYYQEGFASQAKQGFGIYSDFFVLTLLCEDPYWRSTQSISIHREYGTAVDFQDPYPTISSSQVLGETTLVNPGDAEAWPEWTITGPAALLTATNSTRGESFELDPNATAIGHGDLAGGEQVTVMTDPPRVRFQDGSNWTGALNFPGAVLWPLDPGESEVDFQVDSSGPGTAIDLSFVPRYETA